MIKWVLLAAVLVALSAKKGVSVYKYSNQGLSVSLAFQLPDNAQQYLPALFAAEQKYGLPHGLLVRQALQESGFRPDVIDGTTKSAAGAIGIMQIVPRWHPDVNPYDPQASIDYAAKYDAHLYQQFGSWDLALAAYNWGPGNVAMHRNPAQWPTETKNYVAQITSDVKVA